MDKFDRDGRRFRAPRSKKNIQIPQTCWQSIAFEIPYDVSGRSCQPSFTALTIACKLQEKVIPLLLERNETTRTAENIKKKKKKEKRKRNKAINKICRRHKSTKSSYPPYGPKIPRPNNTRGTVIKKEAKKRSIRPRRWNNYGTGA